MIDAVATFFGAFEALVASIVHSEGTIDGAHFGLGVEIVELNTLVTVGGVGAPKTVGNAGLAPSLEGGISLFGAIACLINGIEDEPGNAGHAFIKGAIACSAGRSAVPAEEGSSRFGEHSPDGAGVGPVSIGSGLEGAADAGVNIGAELAATAAW